MQGPFVASNDGAGNLVLFDKVSGHCNHQYIVRCNTRGEFQAIYPHVYLVITNAHPKFLFPSIPS